MYTLKQIAQRGTAWGGVAAFVVAAVAPLASPAFADSLNPLTDRSLTLSSSAPGWENYDGSGNSTYAQPNSGANGHQTGNTFDFKVSTNSALDADDPADGPDAPIKAMTFQYCTTSAGECLAPGDNAVHGEDTDTTSDLKVTFPSPAELASANFGTVVGTDGLVQAVPGFTNPNNPSDTTGQFAASQLPGNFVVYYDNAGTWTQSTGWTLTASNVEDYDTDASKETGQNNFITLTNETGQGFTTGQQVKVVFFGTDDNYIQNPGSGAFFVKINTYSDDTTLDETTLVDGGVTVANVMNHSIRIQTKVLETMKFSVGTVDPNTLDSTDGDDTVGSETPSTLEVAKFADTSGMTGETDHGTCDAILGGMKATDPVNVLKLGNQAAEGSLSDQDTYATHSYWRLSSNSSAGATVYYSGVTLSNTVGDKISAIGDTSAVSLPGDEQFGLGMMNGVAPSHEVDYSQIADFENAPDNGLTEVHASTIADTSGNGSWHTPQLFPLIPNATYAFGGGDGTGTGAIDGTDTTVKFAFDETSNSVPVSLATEDTDVVDCVTGKMRYIANISSTTPAGIYTTAINYIAAPQY